MIFKINRKEHLLEFLDIINKIVIIELRHAGAFVARMWLSKKANFHKRACVRFVF